MLTEILDGDNLSNISYHTFYALKEEFIDNDIRIETLEKHLKEMAKQYDLYKKLITVPGIGLITATALIASIGNASYFKNGRQLSAWLGLVPRQHSSGGKEKLLGISKRGDVYLRTLLIQGARSLFNSKLRYTTLEQQSKKDYSRFTGWMFNLADRSCHNKTVVAIANKLARVVYAVLRNENEYTEHKVCS